MKRRTGWIGLLVAICLTYAVPAGATSILVSSQGILNDPNGIFEQSFTYDPVTMGDTLVIQTLGYGGSANGSILAATGRNLAGNIISPGGFDPIVTLFAGVAGAGGARINFNDDGVCAPRRGTADVSCFDGTLQMTGLAAGTYTIALSAFANFPGLTETSAFTGGGSFIDVNSRVRTNAFAVDAAAISSVPEPASLTLFGTGVAAMLARRRKSLKRW